MTRDDRLVTREDLPEVLVVPPGTAAGDVEDYLRGGDLPAGGRTTSLVEFLAEGRVADCDCGLLCCACLAARVHMKECRYRRTLLSRVLFTCEKHRVAPCPECDACDCGSESGLRGS
jgi:hypothetical protein